MPFYPKTSEDVSQFLVQRKRSPLHVSFGETDHPTAETLSLSHLNAVLIYEPEEMIISVQAGISLEALGKILAEKGQWIPTLAANESHEETLGAAVAADHYHPRARNYGMLRTSILGGTFCTTHGEIFKSGSRVVKSVAGYDIHRAFCGSRGSFGLMLDLTLKVQPLPERFYRFITSPAEKEKLLRFHPSCLEESDGKLLVELSGHKEDIEHDIEQVNSADIKELNESTWSEAIKKLIRLRDSTKKNLSAEVDDVLQRVKKVFDPEGVLV
jgi:FAD/FMN-containing dehydrogenase